MCTFAYGVADPIATHFMLLQEIQIGFDFTFLVLAYLGSTRQNQEGCKMVVVVVVDLIRHVHIIKQFGNYHYGCRFEAKLPEIFKDIHEAYEQIDARLKAEQFKVHESDLIFSICYIISNQDVNIQM